VVKKERKNMGAENKFIPVEHYKPGQNRNFDYGYRNKIASGFVLAGERPEVIALTKPGEQVMEPVSPVIVTLPVTDTKVTILSPRPDFRTDSQLFRDQNAEWRPSPLLPI